MSGDTDLQRIARMIAASEGRILRGLFDHFHHQERILSDLDTAIANTNARVQALVAEVANANAKTDAALAALAALAASVASGAPVTQAQLDAITAIGTEADVATGALQAEESKVDAATGTAAEPPSGSSSEPDAAA